MNKPSIQKSERGIVLITVIIVGMIITFVGISLAELTMKQAKYTREEVSDSNAVLVAEAGIERTVFALNQDSSFSGYGSDQEFFSNTTQGRGVYQTTITSGSGNEKLITATGKVYATTGSNKLISQRKIRVSLVGTSSSGYSVYGGPGGLILSGSANITNSEIYVGGGITMSGAAKIGTNTKPLNVMVGNLRCPTGANPGATYPQVCGSGQQPISFTGSPQIYGTVCATGQTSATRITGGTGGQGLIPGCTAPVQQMPTYDRAAHIAKMTTTGSGSSNTYVCNNWPFTRTWPANLKLTGNVTIGSSCDLTIYGDVYITGNLTINGAAVVRTAESAGARRPVIVVDGTITLGGSGSVQANSQGTGIQFISFKSAAACSPACTSLSGNDLYNSQNLLTVDVGGAVNLPGMVFQAYWGKIKIGGSGNVGTAIGQTIDLSGAGTITFGTTLSSGQSTWTIRSYQELYN